jgi:hypothetical protein
MKTKAWMATMVLPLAVACGGSSDDGSGSGSADMTAGSGAAVSAKASVIAPGDYVLDNASVGATLTVHSANASSVSYDLGVLGKTGSGHNGELDGRTAKVASSGFEDAVDSDCKIAIQAGGTDSVSVKQTGSCSDAGFGAFLDASGTYKKKAADATPSWVGLYENETTHRAWAIRVTSQSPFTFRIFAGLLDDDSERVDAKNLTGQLSGNKVLFEHGPACSIELERTDLGLHVTQTGVCEEIGFPQNDDLSMSDDQGTDFGKIDETKECFDTVELAVGGTKDACKNPL